MMSVQMNKNFETKLLLISLFGTLPLIPLERVCEEILDLSYNTALRKARVDGLPFPALRLEKSQKSKWFVNIEDLALFIDNKSKNARAQWQRAQV